MYPVLAEIAMATSSTTVVTNANRLRKVDIRLVYLLETAKPVEPEGVHRQAKVTA